MTPKAWKLWHAWLNTGVLIIIAVVAMAFAGCATLDYPSTCKIEEAANGDYHRKCICDPLTFDWYPVEAGGWQGRRKCGSEPFPERIFTPTLPAGAKAATP